MRTNLSNTTPEEFARRVAELREEHKRIRAWKSGKSRGLGETIAWKPRSIRDRRPPCVDETLAKELEPAADKLGIKPEHVKHYAQALIKWRAAGYPTRTQEEVDRLLVICQACESFTGSRCRNCGCGVSGGKMAVFNKARMATEDCSEGKWPTRNSVAVGLLIYDLASSGLS